VSGPPSVHFEKELAMSILATRRLPGARARYFRFDPARLVAVLKFMRDAFVEARAMEFEAKRRYRYFD
jgi:hypothetical protein